MGTIHLHLYHPKFPDGLGPPPNHHPFNRSHLKFRVSNGEPRIDLDRPWRKRGYGHVSGVAGGGESTLAVPVTWHSRNNGKNDTGG